MSNRQFAEKSPLPAARPGEVVSRREGERVRMNQSQDKAVKKVLVVEDSQVQAEMYRLVFAKHKCELIFAQNGKEAVQVLTKEPHIDLIVSDINMPEMNGIEFLSMVKRVKLASCPVLIISTKDNLALMEKAVSDRVATHFVVKPWNLKEMWELVQKVMP